MTIAEAPIAKKKLYSVEEFMALPDDPEGRTYELVDGELVKVQGPNFEHANIVENLSSQLAPFARKHNLGRLYAEVTFAYNLEKPRTARRPDLAFVPQAKLTSLNPAKTIPFPPDFAVEVASPSDVLSQIISKVAECRQVGVQLIWVIVPFDRTVQVYRPTSTKPDVFDINDTLSGATVVPEFTIKVADLFAQP